MINPAKLTACGGSHPEWAGTGRLPNAIDIRLCRSGRDWRLFERVPEILHGGDPAFVPPIPGDVAKLGGSAHPFRAHGTLRAYVAHRGGRPVGRIASIVNRTHNEFHGDRTGFFGFFSFEDGDVARGLLEQALRDLAEAGRDVARGPMNPTQNDECGLQVDGFGARPCFGMPYNPPWYVGVYESLGLQGARDLLAYDLDTSMELGFDQRLAGLTARIRERFPMTVRPVDLGRLEQEARLVSHLFNASLAEEWNFMPLSVEDARAWARDLATHLDPEAVLIAEVRGVPAGLSIVLPDLNELLAPTQRLPRWLRLPRLAWLLKTRRCRRGRWAVFGVLPEYRKLGATLLLVYDAIKLGRKRYDAGEISWTQDINPEVNRLAAQLGLEPSRRYRVYEARTS